MSAFFAGRVRGFVLAAALLCALCAPACAEMVWRRGALGDPGSLDPHKATTLIENDVLTELFEGLFARDARGALVPALAQEWSVDPAGVVYRFRLRADALWSNGDRVEAGDFVYAFRRLMDPKTGAPYASILYTLKNAEAVNAGKAPPETLGARALGPLELELTLERPTPYFLEQLAHFTARPLHRASVEASGGDFAHPDKIVTNGPFRLRAFVPLDKVVVEKNPLYRDAASVRLDRQVFIPIEDRSAALRRFMAGEIDSYGEVPVEEIDFVRAVLPDALRLSDSLGGYYLALDTRHAPFDDARVRNALSMALDREFLAGKIWGGTMAPLYGFVPPGIDAYGAPQAPEWAGLSLVRRREEARRLLAEAGREGLKLDIRFNNAGGHRATAVALADMWRAIGVAASVTGTDAATHYALLREKPPFDAARMSWFADYPDAQNFLFLAESGNQGLNAASFDDPVFDALMRAAGEAADPGERRAKLREAEALLLRAQPFIPLMAYRASRLVSPRIKGFEPNALDVHPGRFVTVAPE